MAGNRKGRRRRFGSVRQLPSGRYQARYPDPHGVMRSAPRTFETETDADVWLTVTEAEMVKGEWWDPDVGRTPLGPYVARWIEERPLADGTRDRYGYLLRGQIEPHLGRVDLADLTPARVRSWRKELLDAGTGASTVAKAYRLLRAVLNTAANDEDPPLIRRNPCRIKGADKETPAERPVATVDEVYAIADVIRPWCRCLVLLAGFTGIRWGELTGLRRRHLDLSAGFVRVPGTKSEAARREVGIPATLIPELRGHLRRWAEPGWSGRVFVGPRGGVPRSSNYQRYWNEALGKAGLAETGLHFHDLRHTANSFAAPEASLRELMARMGHSSQQAALIYQHANREREQEITTAVDKKIKAARKRKSGRSGTDVARGRKPKP